jgi:hypothetical protein
MLFNLETIGICTYMLNNVNKQNKFAYLQSRFHESNLYHIRSYNAGYAKKICRYKHPSTSYHL